MENDYPHPQRPKDSALTEEMGQNLRQRVEEIRQQVDEMRQKVHCTTQELQVEESMFKDCLDEKSYLKKEEADHSKWQLQVSKLEETLTATKSKNSDLSAHLESLINDLDSKYETLLREKNYLKKKKKAQQSDMSCSSTEVEYLEEKMQTLSENERLRDNIAKLQAQNENLLEVTKLAHVAIEEKRKQIQNYTDIIKDQNENIDNKVKIIKANKEELLAARHEVEMHKNIPLPDGSKGNCMFGEVEDRRVQLQESINKMKAGFIYLQQEGHRQEKMLSNLYKKRTELLVEISSRQNDIEQGNISYFQSNIDSLQQTIQEQGVQLDSKLRILDTFTNKYKNRLENKYFQGIIDSQQKAILSQEEKLFELTKKICEMTQYSGELEHVLRELQIRNLELQHQIEESKNKLDFNEEEIVCRRYTIFKT